MELGRQPSIVATVVRGFQPLMDGIPPAPMGPNIVTNGDGSDGTNGWTAIGGTLSNSGGRLVVSAAGLVVAGMSQSLVTTPGTTYRVAATVAKPDGILPLVQMSAGGVSVQSALLGGDQLLTLDFTASAASTTLAIQTTGNVLAGVTVEVANVSARAVL